MIQKIAVVEFEGLKTFPCISSNLANSDWQILWGLVRSPRKYYQLVLLSDEQIFIGDIVLKNDNITLHSVHGETHSKIIAAYPKLQNLPTFTLNFLEEWIKNPVKSVDVAYNHECGFDFNKSTLIVFNDMVGCKIVDIESYNQIVKKCSSSEESLDDAALAYAKNNLYNPDTINEIIGRKMKDAFIAGSLDKTTGNYWFELFKPMFREASNLKNEFDQPKEIIFEEWFNTKLNK